MNTGLAQLRMLVWTECLLRLRRSSTWVTFLILCGFAYLLMPDSKEGMAIFKVQDQRVIVNSAAAALATSLTGGLLLSLIGFYLVSNSLERDRRTGVGRLIVAAPVSSLRYLAGKAAGNAAYLFVVTLGFMIACMGMFLLRGEAPLEPLPFLATYAVFLLPLIVVVSAVALLFESVPLLAGRAGDVVYFFFWSSLLVLPVIPLAQGGEPTWESYLDVTGLGFAVVEIRRVMHSANFSIGLSPFNPLLPPLVFPGLPWNVDALLPRLASSLLAVPMIGVAAAAFRRFDPSVGTVSAARSQRWPVRLWRSTMALLRRRAAPRGGWPVGRPSFLRAVVLDLRLTLAIHPIVPVLALVFSVVGIAASTETLRTVFMPVFFAAMTPFTAGIPSRDRTNNTLALLFAAPLLQRQYVAWKSGSIIAMLLVVGFVPLFHLMITDPWLAVTMAVGMAVMAGSSTLLGTATGGPKAFMVSFLFFLYLVMNSRTIPALDFAGWNGLVTGSIAALYAAAALAMVTAAWVLSTGRRL